MGNCDFTTKKTQPEAQEEAATINKNNFYQQYVIGKGGYGRVNHFIIIFRFGK